MSIEIAPQDTREDSRARSPSPFSARRSLAAAAPAALGADPKPGGAVNVATIGKPPTLDAMESPAGMVGIISRHIFETLFT